MSDQRSFNRSWAEIPFLRLRRWLPRELLAGASGYAELAHGLQRALEHPEPVLRVRPCLREVRLGDAALPLQPKIAALVALLALRRARGEVGNARRDGSAAGRVGPFDDAAEYIELYARFTGAADHPRVVAARDSLARGFPKAFFHEPASRCNDAVVALLGEHRAEPYLIRRRGGRMASAYELAVPSHLLEVHAPGVPPTLRPEQRVLEADPD